MNTLFQPISSSRWATIASLSDNFITIYETVYIKTSFKSGIKYSYRDGQSVLHDYELDIKDEPQSYKFLYEEIERRKKSGVHKYFFIEFANGVQLIVSSVDELKQLLDYF